MPKFIPPSWLVGSHPAALHAIARQFCGASQVLTLRDDELQTMANVATETARVCVDVALKHGSVNTAKDLCALFQIDELTVPTTTRASLADVPRPRHIVTMAGVETGRFQTAKPNTSEVDRG